MKLNLIIMMMRECRMVIWLEDDYVLIVEEKEKCINLTNILFQL